MQYFSYSPDVGFDLHSSPESAKLAAQASIDAYDDDAGDGWSEDVEHVCWGEVKEMASMVNKRPAEPHTGMDYMCEYALLPDTPTASEGGEG